MKLNLKNDQVLIDSLAGLMVEHYFENLENETLPRLTAAQKKRYQVLEKRYTLSERKR